MISNSTPTSASDLEAGPASGTGQQDPQPPARSLPHALTMVAPPCPVPPSPALSLEAAETNEIGQQDPQSPARSLPHSSTMVAPPPPAPPSPALRLDAAQTNEIGQQDSQLPHSATAGAIPIPNPVSPDSGGQGVVTSPQDWKGVVIGFCLTSAVEIALQSLQPKIEFPLLVPLLSLSIVCAFCSFLVSNFISAHHPRLAHALIQVGKLLVFIAFILAISVSFLLFFKHKS